MMSRQTVLVAGATGNVGGATAAALAAGGAQVVLLGRKPGALQARAEAIRAGRSDADIETLVIDFSDLDSVRRAAVEALDRFAEIDALVLSVVTLVQDGPHVLPNGHELMFATNVLGPFLFSQLLLDRLQQSHGLVVHVVAPFHEDIDWDDLESIERHKTGVAYDRTKTMNRMIAGEMARRSDGTIASVAASPPFVIDKDDPALQERWPKGFTGAFWRVMTAVAAKPPSAAGGPIADLVLAHPDRESLNGVLVKRDKPAAKRDKAMGDEAAGQRLWRELERMVAPARQ
jgi:NAD(P)-dependent dehydrogenase (short-subunit alcohol dehydrogenase family)